MLSLLRDVTQTWQLQARYRRLVQKQLLELAESESHVTSDADDGAWKPASGAGLLDHREASTNYDALRERARELVNRHPYARNLLRLLEIYVAGPGLQISHRASVCQLAAAGAICRTGPNRADSYPSCDPRCFDNPWGRGSCRRISASRNLSFGAVTIYDGSSADSHDDSSSRDAPHALRR